MKEPEVSPAVPSYSSYSTPDNRAHYRLKTAAVLLTVLLYALRSSLPGKSPTRHTAASCSTGSLLPGSRMALPDISPVFERVTGW